MSLDNIELRNIDVKTLCSLIDRCKGDVYLVTNESDRLNLKSKLCQIVGLTNLIEGAKIATATLHASDPEDDSMLFRYILYEELPN